MNTTKKRDCNLAVPLTEALVLPFVTNSNTEPTPYVYYIDRYALTRTRINTHTIGILVSQCFVTLV